MSSKKVRSTIYAEEKAQKPVARELEVATVSNDIDLPDNGPMPEARYVTEASQDNGDLLADEPTNTVPVVRTKTIKITKKVASLDSDVPVPQADLTAEPKLEKAEKPERAEKVDSLTTASTSMDGESKGWVIQVGAAPGKEQAMNLLQKAQDKGGKVLRSATPFTVAFSKGNDQVFRARFSGFADQDAAVNACKVLKRRGVSCWASLQ